MRGHALFRRELLPPLHQVCLAAAVALGRRRRLRRRERRLGDLTNRCAGTRTQAGALSPCRVRFKDGHAASSSGDPGCPQIAPRPAHPPEQPPGRKRNLSRVRSRCWRLCRPAARQGQGMAPRRTSNGSSNTDRGDERVRADKHERVQDEGGHAHVRMCVCVCGCCGCGALWSLPLAIANGRRGPSGTPRLVGRTGNKP